MYHKILELDKVINGFDLIPTDHTDEWYEQEIVETCALLRSKGLVNVNEDYEYRIFNMISIGSILCSILIFLTTLWNTKLNTHPY